MGAQRKRCMREGKNERGEGGREKRRRKKRGREKE